MSMFDFLKKKSTTAGDTFVVEPVEIQTLEVIPEDPSKYIYPVSTDEHRRGMWVTTGEGRVGILHKFLENSNAEVHLTDAAGLTIEVQEIPLTSLIRAKRSELPAARMEQAGHTPSSLIRFGYGD